MTTKDRIALELDTCDLLIRLVEENLDLPEPRPEFQTQVAECNKSELIKQREMAIYAMRQAQLEELGFVAFAREETVQLLMGEPHTEIIALDRLNYDYHYRHHEGTVETGKDCTWGITTPHSYIRKEKARPWFLPPFQGQVVWEVSPILKLDDFKSPLPDFMLQALNHMKQKGFFNCYHGYQNEKTGEAVLLGQVESLIPGSKNSSGCKYYILGFFGAAKKA